MEGSKKGREGVVRGGRGGCGSGGEGAGAVKKAVKLATDKDWVALGTLLDDPVLTGLRMQSRKFPMEVCSP